MKILANEFKEQFSLFAEIAKSNKDNSNGGNVYFNKDKAFLFNGTIYLEKKFETDFSGGIDTGFLIALLDRYGNNEIEVYNEENNIIFKKKRSVTKVVLDSNIPEVKFDDESEWRKIPVDFSKNCGFAEGMTGNNFSEPVKTAVHIKGRYVEAGDGFCFGIFKIKGNIADDLFIRKDFVKILAHFNPTEYCLQDTWLTFRNNDNYRISFLKLDIPEYPNLQEMFDVCNEGHEIEFPTKIIASIERATLMLQGVEDFDKSICLCAKDGKLTIKTESKIGNYTDKISCNPDANFNVKINPNYLTNLLFHSNKLKVGKTAITLYDEKIKLAACLMD